ncbi:MAG: insulinase family protein, partial [Bdellovibrionales bacterium]
IFRDQAFDIDALVQSIDRINVTDIQKIAARIFAGKPTLAALGPLGKLEDYDRIAGRLAA